MVQLSDSARTELDAFFTDKPKSGIRIYLAPGGCSGPRLALALDEPTENDKSFEAIDPDGILDPIEHTGRTGGLPIVGLGVYRKWLDIPEESRGQRIFLEFDGVMWNADIYIGGKKLFFNHFGYKSFCVEITDFVTFVYWCGY